MAQQPIVIRKYENRRLYDTAASRYVNLDEIAGMIREGKNVQVLDARTGEDLTRVILTQIIVEDAKESESAFPLDFLRQLVMASGRAGEEGFAGYMSKVFESSQRAYNVFEKRLRETAPMAVAPLDFLQAIFQPKAPAAASGPEPGGSEAEPSTPCESDKASGTPAAGDATELAELRRRIDQLERRLAERPERQAAPPRPRRKPRASAPAGKK